MRRAKWQAESQAVRNVAEAIERVLAEVNPVSEAVMWDALGPLGVTRAQFDAALRTLEVGRAVRRAGGRVFYGKGELT